MRRDGSINIQTENNVLSMYNPDGITTYTYNGKTYLITANEGDSRDWNGYKNEKDIVLGKGQDGNATKDMKVTTFDTSDYEVGTGFDVAKTYLFGARSFAVWDADTMSLVYDSGAEIEKRTVQLLPEYFNWSNDDTVFEKRSAKKGAEPEDVKVGTVNGKPYVFISLERIGGNMMFDISNINKPVFYDYLNTREFSGAIAGDVSPEGQCFVAANDSPTKFALLFVANEVSGTVSVVQIGKRDADGGTTINILHTNDSHGRVFADKNNSGMIGIDKIASIKDSTANSLLVDAGDTIHGLPIANTTQGSNVVELMNLAGYDVMTPGNHDFNYGSGKLKEYAVTNTINFDIISSNIFNKNDKSLFLPSTSVKTIDGVKIGFFGLTTTETPTVTNPVNVESLEFRNYHESAKSAIAVLKEQKVDIIVGLAHVSRPYVEALAKELKDDVDVFIDGHDHLSTNVIVDGVLIASSGQYEENLGQVTITVDNNNQIISKTAGLIKKADTKDIVQDAGVNAKATSLMSVVNELFSIIIGKSEVKLDSSRGDTTVNPIKYGVRNSETALGNLVADAMRITLGADIALTNGGGLRANIEIGDITKGDLNSVLPFGNYGVVKKVTPKQLKEILENGLSKYPAAAGQFPQISGMKVEFNPNTTALSRVTKITIGSAVLNLTDDKTTYKLATNDFMASGGDGYTVIKNLETVTEGDSLDVLFENYVKSLENATITANIAKVEGRISAVIPQSNGDTPSSSGGQSTIVDQNKNDIVSQTKAEIKPTVDAKTGEAKAKLSDDTAKKLLEQAVANEKVGKATMVEISVQTPKDAKKSTVELGNAFVQKVAAETKADLAINTGFATITLKNVAIDAISSAAKGEVVSLSVEPVTTSGLSESVKAKVSDRLVYDIKVYAGTTAVTSFGGEKIKISIPYTLKASENKNALVVYYLDNSGNLVPVTAKYNDETKCMDILTDHLSKYVVAYNYINFSDISGHWSQSNIDFVVARGLFSGTGAGKFSPDQAVTRGMLITVLGKLANASTSKTVAFADVSADKYYAGYIGWVVENKIASGVGNNRFDADRAVTREEMAVILNNFVKVMKLNSTDTSTAGYADSASISSWAKQAISNMQALGLDSGKSNNMFSPKAVTTRAEVATILKNIVEISMK
jgi:2',3'-cyclic-nucleotide 2'-phosphodiesterase (5'-nucleotidase family)